MINSLSAAHSRLQNTFKKLSPGSCFLYMETVGFLLHVFIKVSSHRNVFIA